MEEEQTQEQLDLYCDGSSANNLGPASRARWAVAFKSGKKLVDVHGWGTNNEAEYKGLIAALNWVMLMPQAAHVVIHMDSETVFMQVVDRHNVKSKRLKELCTVAKKLMDTTITRVLSLELVLATGEKNPAHITISSTPDVFNGITHIVDLLPKYQEMLNTYNEQVKEDSVIDTSRRPFDGEIRQEAHQWLWEKGYRVIGTFKAISSKTFVDSLYAAGAKLVEVVDATVDRTEGQSCTTLRVKLPFDPDEDTKSEETPTADKALACLTLMTDTAEVQQAWDNETAFYVIW